MYKVENQRNVNELAHRIECSFATGKPRRIVIEMSEVPLLQKIQIQVRWVIPNRLAIAVSPTNNEFPVIVRPSNDFPPQQIRDRSNQDAGKKDHKVRLLDYTSWATAGHRRVKIGTAIRVTEIDPLDAAFIISVTPTTDGNAKIHLKDGRIVKAVIQASSPKDRKRVQKYLKKVHELKNTTAYAKMAQAMKTFDSISDWILSGYPALSTVRVSENVDLDKLKTIFKNDDLSLRRHSSYHELLVDDKIYAYFVLRTQRAAIKSPNFLRFSTRNDACISKDHITPSESVGDSSR
jgi:hypothetical protein